MTFWEVHPGQSEVELSAEEFGGGRRLRRMFGQEAIDQIDDAPLVGAHS